MVWLCILIQRGGVMNDFVVTLVGACCLAAAGAVSARPYAGVSGLAASADSAATAGTNREHQFLWGEPA